MKFKTPEFSEESSARAAAADEPKNPIEPEIVDDSPKVDIDPAIMHGLMVMVIKGLVLRVDQWQGWNEHPNDEWCESTTQVVEVLLEKYFGGLESGPEVLLCFNLAVWMVPNLMVEKAKENAAKAKAGDAATQTQAGNEPINEPRKENPDSPVEMPDFTPFEDAVV